MWWAPREPAHDFSEDDGMPFQEILPAEQARPALLVDEG